MASFMAIFVMFSKFNLHKSILFDLRVIVLFW